MTCPACPNCMPPSAVLCPACWRRVPRAYRLRVKVRAEGVARAVRGNNVALIAVHMRLYRQACEAAVGFLKREVTSNA